MQTGSETRNVHAVSHSNATAAGAAAAAAVTRSNSYLGALRSRIMVNKHLVCLFGRNWYTCSYPGTGSAMMKERVGEEVVVGRRKRSKKKNSNAARGEEQRERSAASSSGRGEKWRQMRDGAGFI